MFKSLRLRLIVAIAIALPALPVCANSLSVHVSIVRDGTKDKSFMKSGTFWVETSVKNSGSKDENITVWTQPGWSWVTDNPAVAPDIEATKNIQTTVTLAPGKAYESRVQMHLVARAKKPIKFRLGFVPNTDRPVSTLPANEKPEKVIWSNPLFLGR